MIIHTIALAGIDNNVSIEDILELVHSFPQVELGICLSQASMGKARYPTIDYLTALAEHKHVRLSAHICGQWMKDILLGKATIKEDLSSIWDRFSRIQFNYVDYLTNEEKVAGDYKTKAENLLRTVKENYFTGKGLIFPLNPHSEVLLNEYVLGHHFAQVLHDCSMGLGKLPEKWPAPFHSYHTGYAGGLSPENIATEVVRISEVVPDNTAIWIDAESGLRTNNEFDMQKAITFCQIANSY